MIERTLAPQLRQLATRVPAVAVTGPRQSGKTTLCRMVFPDRKYVSLEPLDTRDFARSDPRGFLRQYAGEVIFDEVQRAPDLFSYLQEAIDEDPRSGRFILTGSQHFGLSEAISQSLAGRVGLLHLLPLSLEEVRRFPGGPDELWPTVQSGGYPRIHDRELDPTEWLRDYTATYVQRDVRQVLNVTDLDAFTTFLRLLAGRTAQELNRSSLGSDAGVTHNTARAWLSVLETSFLGFRVPRWHRSFRKRVVKSPKIHLVDTGLVCYLLGIRDPEQLLLHPLRGHIFETWVASEILKWRLNRGLDPAMYHLRETRGIEIDLILEAGERLLGVEMKSGATVTSDHTAGLRAFGEAVSDALPRPACEGRLVYGGDAAQTRGDVRVVPWSEVPSEEW